MPCWALQPNRLYLTEYINNPYDSGAGEGEIQHENIGSNMTIGQIWPIYGSFDLDYRKMKRFGVSRTEDYKLKWQSSNKWWIWRLGQYWGFYREKIEEYWYCSLKRIAIPLLLLRITSPVTLTSTLLYRIVVNLNKCSIINILTFDPNGRDRSDSTKAPPAQIFIVLSFELSRSPFSIQGKILTGRLKSHLSNFLLSNAINFICSKYIQVKAIVRRLANITIETIKIVNHSTGFTN